eukprot:6661302-Prymnesium_polylepis.1
MKSRVARLQSIKSAGMKEDLRKFGRELCANVSRGSYSCKKTRLGRENQWQGCTFWRLAFWLSCLLCSLRSSCCESCRTR